MRYRIRNQSTLVSDSKWKNFWWRWTHSFLSYGKMANKTRRVRHPWLMYSATWWVDGHKLRCNNIYHFCKNTHKYTNLIKNPRLQHRAPNRDSRGSEYCNWSRTYAKSFRLINCTTSDHFKNIGFVEKLISTYGELNTRVAWGPKKSFAWVFAPFRKTRVCLFVRRVAVYQLSISWSRQINKPK